MFKSLINKAKEFLVGAPKTQTVQPIAQEDKVTPVMEAPYKIEAPAVTAPVVSQPKKAEKKPAAKKAPAKKRATKKTTKA